MRGLPFFKAKNKPQFAGLNFSDAGSSGGGGGGGGGSSDFEYKEFTTNMSTANFDLDNNIDLTRIVDIIGYARSGNSNHDYQMLGSYLNSNMYAHAYVSQTATGKKLYFASPSCNEAKIILVLKKED